MAPPLLSCEGVSKAHGTTQLLDGITLGVAEGERIGVVGRNGGGKSTLVKVLAALAAGDPVRLGRSLVNDLQAPAVALRPELRGPLEAGIALGALGVVVSGSGLTVALLAGDDEHADSLATALAREGVCRAVRTARGPVAGVGRIEPTKGTA